MGRQGGKELVAPLLCDDGVSEVAIKSAKKRLDLRNSYNKIQMLQFPFSQVMNHICGLKRHASSGRWTLN